MRRFLPLVVLLLAAPGKRSESLIPTEEAPFRLFLNDPVGKPAPGKTCDQAVCQVLLQLIEGSKTSIDFAIYGIRGQQDIFDALLKAQARGVQVRGYIDRTLDGENYYADTDALVKALGTVKDDLEVDRRKAAKQTNYDPETAMCWWPAPAGFLGPKQCVGYDLGDKCVVAVHASHEELSFQGDIMHDKFFVVDEQYVWMGSTNVSDSCSGGYNANVVGVLRSPVVASWYTKEFLQLWNGLGHDEKQSQGQLSAQLTARRTRRRLLQPAGPADDPSGPPADPEGARAHRRRDLLPHPQGRHQGPDRRPPARREGADHHRRHRRHQRLHQTRADPRGRHPGQDRELGRQDAHEVGRDRRRGHRGRLDELDQRGRARQRREHPRHPQPRARRPAPHLLRPHLGLDARPLAHRPPRSRGPRVHTACTDKTDNDFDHMADDERPWLRPQPAAARRRCRPYLIVPKGPGQNLIKGNMSSQRS
jgi:hypothetical protein